MQEREAFIPWSVTWRSLALRWTRMSCLCALPEPALRQYEQEEPSFFEAGLEDVRDNSVTPYVPGIGEQRAFLGR